jgi:hypothetical protein
MKNHTNRTKTMQAIPPPPGIEAGYDAVIAYHEKYSLSELREAGYLEKAPSADAQELAASATFQLLCKNGLQVRLSQKDCKALSLLAARLDVEVGTLVKQWIKERLQPRSTLPAE